MRPALLALAVSAASAVACAPARHQLNPAGGPEPSPRPAGLAQIDAILEEQRERLHIPGLAFAVVKDGEVVYLKAFGQRDLERGQPATPDTLFPIGSCTKAFTAMAAALSQDRGLLSLDDRPHKYLPYFRMADPEADAGVTLRDMLSHQTGLKAYADLAAEPGVLTRRARSTSGRQRLRSRRWAFEARSSTPTRCTPPLARSSARCTGPHGSASSRLRSSRRST
jgi:CubicO group peptidase (beta-lactamase class C family)